MSVAPSFLLAPNSKSIEERLVLAFLPYPDVRVEALGVLALEKCDWSLRRRESDVLDPAMLVVDVFCLGVLLAKNDQDAHFLLGHWLERWVKPILDYGHVH